MGALNIAHCAFESPAEEYISGVKQNPSIKSMLAHYCALTDSAQPVKDRLSVLKIKWIADLFALTPLSGDIHMAEL